jgi:hypothetical protein
MPLHPAWVKNISRRVLWAAIEPDITKDDRAEMRDFFEGRCAYCQNQLSERWHADHLVPVDHGGFNHISNRVPACSKCNEKEKQDREWIGFLDFKCGNDRDVFEAQLQKIISWRDSHLPKSPPVTEAQREEWRAESIRLAAEIDASWNKLKLLKAQG